jgi:hypothetical protein
MDYHRKEVSDLTEAEKGKKLASLIEEKAKLINGFIYFSSFCEPIKHSTLEGLVSSGMLLLLMIMHELSLVCFAFFRSRLKAVELFQYITTLSNLLCP